MKYKSTRSKDRLISASEAVIMGIADDGGLYVPFEIPKLDGEIKEIVNLSYKDLAYCIMKKYFTDFDEGELRKCIKRAYDDKFDTQLIAPLVEVGEVNFLELYHGATLAFKDMALSILPHLLKAAVGKKNIKKEIVILTATSGDTGKAALEGFANVEGAKIIVFFPQNGVSEIQRRQMITQEGKNTFVVGIDGNFDDAQSGVKRILNDREFTKRLNENNYILSSANSINIGRLIPQIVYYFYGYLGLLKNKKIQNDECINVVVPTGNFGNILAAYYAKEMGLPINKLICASNENNVLYDFFKTGIYDRKRELRITASPSMDILVSSNVERLLYGLSGGDEELIKGLMGSLKTNGKYEITEDMKNGLSDFYGGYANEDEVFKGIKSIYNSTGYVMDTHTAVAYCVYKKYKEETNDITKTIIASTASPFKFGRSVCKAIGINVEGLDDFGVIEEFSKTCKIEIPYGIKNLKDKRIVHNNLCKKADMKSAIEKFLKV